MIETLKYNFRRRRRFILSGIIFILVIVVVPYLNSDLVFRDSDPKPVHQNPLGSSMSDLSGGSSDVAETPASSPSPSITLAPLAHASPGASPAPGSSSVIVAPPMVHIANPPIPVSNDGNEIANPSLEDTDADGNVEGWTQSQDGNNNATFSYPVPGRNRGSAGEVSISSYADGEAQWYFEQIPVTAGDAYRFSDYYISNTETYMSVQFRSASGAESWHDIAALPPAGDWTQGGGTFIVPDGTVALTAYQLIKNVGTLTTDDYSLTKIPASFSSAMVSLNFDDGWQSAYDVAFPVLRAANMPGTFYIISGSVGNGKHYMTRDEILALQAAGEEIGAHTETHPDLRTVSPAQVQTEVDGSVAALKAMGIQSVTTFAYPYGGYNSTTDAIVRQSGLLAARTTDGDIDFPESDRYLLKAQVIQSDTTVAQIEQWVDAALQHKEWLILVFHQIGEPAGGGDSYTMTKENFQAVINYLKQVRVPIVTNAQAVENLSH